MSDDEVIRFEITDYDLDNEFNPNRRGRAKKEEQIYGMYCLSSIYSIILSILFLKCPVFFCKVFHQFSV